MSVLAQIANCNIGDANAYYLSHSFALSQNSSTSSTSLLTEQLIPVTFSANATLKGVAIGIQGSGAACDRSVTVKLQKLITGVWTDQGTPITLTATQISNNNSAPNGVMFVVFDGINAAYTTAAATFRFSVIQTGGTTGNWVLRNQSTGGAFCYASYSTTTASFVSNQDQIICAANLTVNADTTFKEDTTSSICFWGCTGGTVTWAGNHTHTIRGKFMHGHGFSFLAGTVGSPIAKASPLVFNFSNALVSSIAGSYSGSNSDSGLIWLTYGETPTCRKCTLSANATIGDTSIKTTDDVSSWTNGQQIYIGGQNVKGVGEAGIYTLSGAPSLSAGVYTINLTAALTTNNRLAGGTVLMLNGYGIIFNGTTTNIGSITLARTAQYSSVGVCVVNTVYGNNTGNTDDAANRTSSVFQNNLMYQTVNLTSQVFTGCAGAGFECSGNYSTGGSIALSNAGTRTTTSYTHDNFFCNAQNTSTPSSSYHLVSNNRFENFPISFNGTTVSGSGNIIWGCATGCGISSCNNSTFSNFTIDNCTLGLQYNASVFVNCIGFSFGQSIANTTDVNAVNFSIDKMISPTGNLSVTATNLADGGSVRMSNFNVTAGDYRSWNNLGHFISNGTTGLDAYNDLATTALTNQYNMTSETVASVPMAVLVTEQIGNAAYYAGTNTLPTLNIDYDTTPTTVSTVASANTSAQTLMATFTPSTSNNPMAIRLTQKTDASVANSKVTWSNLTVRARKYSKVYAEKVLALPYTTDDTVYDVPTPTTDPYITQTNAATVAAYTGIAINDSTQTITISSNHTLHELYDYTKWYLTQHFDIADFFTTTDGVNYTSSYNIIVNTGVNLTGGGSINCGTKTFTLTGTATYDGIFIDVTGTSVILSVTGLVAGSTVQLYNTTDSSELYNAVVAGTSTSQRFLWATNKAIRVRARKAAYIPYEATGTITNTGFSVVVSQQSDTVYVANNIDGSTITDCAFSGSTVKIYVDEATNLIDIRNIYAWYMYNISTTTYIGLQPYDITAQTSYSYVLHSPLTIHNQRAAVLTINNGNVVDENGTAGWIDVAGTIILNSYFPLPSLTTIGTSVWANGQALTVGKFIGLK